MDELVGLISGFFKSAQSLTGGLNERRNAVRIRCNFAVQCTAGDEQFKAKIIDLGMYGLRLEVPRRINEGQKVALRFNYRFIGAAPYVRDSICTKVIWCRRRRRGAAMEAGVIYVDSDAHIEGSWVRFIQDKVGFDVGMSLQQRAMIRAEGRIPLAFTHGDASSREKGLVLNIGAGGVLTESREEIPEGAQLSLTIGPHFNLGPVTVQGVAVTRRFIEEETTWRTGIRFVDLTEKQTSAVGRYVLTLLKS